MTWTAERIKNLLATNDKAVARGVIALYKRQTADEQNSEHTKHNNGIGFNQADARYLSYCARWAMSRYCLTGRHLEKARTRLMKYAGQLAEIANEKAGQTPESTGDEERRRELEMKAMFAAREREQEAVAFMSKMRGSW